VKKSRRQDQIIETFAATDHWIAARYCSLLGHLHITSVSAAGIFLHKTWYVFSLLFKSGLVCSDVA